MTDQPFEGMKLIRSMRKDSALQIMILLAAAALLRTSSSPFEEGHNSLGHPLLHLHSRRQVHSTYMQVYIYFVETAVQH